MSELGWMLCLDASAPRTCVALGRIDDDNAGFVGPSGPKGFVLTDEAEDGANQTSERLHERLAAMLDEAAFAATGVRWIACGRGPGTFTGTRVAVSTAKGLAIGLGLPIVPVSTLAALAASAGHEGRVLALLDARRGQVYGGLFGCSSGGIEALSDERVIELGTLIEELGDAVVGDDVIAFGPGCRPYAEQLPEELRARAVDAPGPSAMGLWRASVTALRAGVTVDPGELQVSYLRMSYAEMGINTPKRAVFKSPFV